MRHQFWILLLLAGSILGCGGSKGDKWTEKRPTVYPVKGKVTLNGQPVADAMVAFRSGTGDAAVGASGKTDSNGDFTLTTYDPGDGAVAGSHQVTVTKIVIEGEDPSYFDVNSPNYGKDPPPTKKKFLVPEKFSKFETSELTASVTESRSNSVVLDLKD